MILAVKAELATFHDILHMCHFPFPDSSRMQIQHKPPTNHQFWIWTRKAVVRQLLSCRVPARDTLHSQAREVGVG